MVTPAALLPPGEAERLRTLRHYNLLAAPPEVVFQQLVALAAHVFGLPEAFLALVDAHHVRYPAAYGGGLPPVPRGEALCASALLHPRAVAYENLALASQSGPDAPAVCAVLAQGVRFYAAAPLRMPNGHTIGVLCLAGPHPRSFSPAEKEVLEALADIASLTIAVRHRYRATPALGPEQWQTVQHRVRHDLHALRMLLRDLLEQHGAQAPVPPAVLHPLLRRLQALRVVLSE